MWVMLNFLRSFATLRPVGSKSFAAFFLAVFLAAAFFFIGFLALLGLLAGNGESAISTPKTSDKSVSAMRLLLLFASLFSLESRSISEEMSSL